jgi:hypothetical protein
VETLTAFVAPSDAGLATQAVAVTASATSTGKPSLQNAAVAGGLSRREGLIGLVIAGAAGAIALL